jgi:hypothetical protein
MGGLQPRLVRRPVEAHHGIDAALGADGRLVLVVAIAPFPDGARRERPLPRSASRCSDDPHVLPMVSINPDGGGPGHKRDRGPKCFNGHFHSGAYVFVHLIWRCGRDPVLEGSQFIADSGYVILIEGDTR